MFGLSDVVLTTLAFEAAYLTRTSLDLERVFYLTVQIKALVLGSALFSWLVVGSWLRVYEKLNAGDPRVILWDSVRQCAYSAIGLVLFEYMLRLDLSRLFLLLFFSFAFLFLFLFRLVAGRGLGLLRREFGEAQFVVLVGTGDRALGLARLLERSEQYGIRLVGFFSDEDDAPAEVKPAFTTYPVWPLRELPALLKRRAIDEVIFSVGSERLSNLEDVFLACDDEGVRTRVAVDFFPHVNSTVYLERLGYMPLLTFSAGPQDEIRLMLKRGLDVVVAAIGLLVLLPFMALLAVAIRLTSPGPAIFRQVRCGLNGRRFVFYKFRSMREDAEILKPQLMHLNKRKVVFKIPGDPRTTSLGRILRKFSIDEWPQLWNVLKGDMSLVGPRPAVPDEVDQYQRWQRRRLRMRPGLTCLWALAGRDSLDFETWMKMDMQYIDNWSLALDWKILLRTIPRVLIGRGAH
ncbi:MAG TPA: sugar transferase [Bryobacteraceae bacterium]|nr:sugar transferase [Bryobacteraceae bacterium]